MTKYEVKTESISLSANSFKVDAQVKKKVISEEKKTSSFIVYN